MNDNDAPWWERQGEPPPEEPWSSADAHPPTAWTLPEEIRGELIDPTADFPSFEQSVTRHADRLTRRASPGDPPGPDIYTDTQAQNELMLRIEAALKAKEAARNEPEPDG